MPGDRTLIYEFVSEAKEHLANLADDLLALEQAQDDSRRFRIDRSFRAVHSVKGGAGFFGCQAVETLAHALETVLDDLRHGHLPPASHIIDALLAGTDRLLALLDDVEHSNQVDLGDLLARLRSLVPGQPVEPFPETQAPGPVPVEGQAAFAFSELPLANKPAGEKFLFGVKIDLGACQQRAGLSPAAVLQRLQAQGTILNGQLDVPPTSLAADLSPVPVIYRALISSALGPESWAKTLGIPSLTLVLLETETVSEPTPSTSLPVPSERASLPARQPEPGALSIRIPVRLVDRLMNLTGELVLVRNQAVRACEPRDQVLRPLVQRLDKVTAELQDAVLRTRMQPVSVLFSKFPRLVRDLARQLGKQIELLMSGTEVELDKNVLEWLSDPLTHLVRNCCDHGIEPPERRKQAGKPVEGRVFLNARHAGGQIVIEIRDDGRGIDPQAIRRKAVQLGMRTQAEAARLTDQEVLSLVLLPGFSTAQVVTDLSGRGVGLDVVKTNLDRLGGVLEIASESGQGTALTLSVPLTLAIIPCLLVVVEGSRYALPQKDLEELICLQKDQARLRIESAFDQEVVRLRDRLVPLVRLTEVLARPAPFTASTKAEIVRKYQNQSVAKQFLAVVKVGSQRLGLILDEILTTEEIVVQPLHAGLRRLACFAGSTILGDGQVALILSTEGVARHAGVNFELAHETAPRLPGEVPLVESQVVLLFQYGPKEQLAVPLSMIRRIQRIHARDIERVGDREFITLEGNSTPLLRLDRLLPVSSCPDLETMLVLLPNNLPRPVAVILSAVVDTETLSVDLDTRAFQANGVLGTAVLRGRMTLFLDLYRLADQMALPAPEGTPLLPARKRRILLIEDTAFFRELVKGYLQGAGYEVVTAVHGAEGLERLQEQPFDLVVSDIEMPVMDGWTLARTMRSLPEGRNMPLLALTTLSSEAHRDKARECGFDRYEVKLERDRFLESVAALLGKSS